MTTAPMTEEAIHQNASEILRPCRIRAQVKALLTEPNAHLEDDDHLIELGLDSLQLMRLANQWRKAGADVSFAQLIERPRLCDWWPLLSRRRTQEVVAAGETSRPSDDPASFALTDVQHAYWIGRGEEQVLGGVGCHAYLELDGRDVDPSRLEHAWAGLLARHGMLRTRFDDQGRQSISPVPAEATRQVQVHDLRKQASEVAEQTLATIREQRSHRRLRVNEGEVAGLSLSLLPDGTTRLHFDIDLLVADVQSLHVILRDLAALYAHESLPHAPINWHFGHHLEAQTKRRGDALEEAGHYWSKRLPLLPGAPALPLRCAPETLASPRFTRRVHKMPATRWARLQRFAASARITPAMVLATTYAEVLAAWSTVPRFLLNLPLFDRHGDTPGLDNVVADFTNLLLLEVDCREPMPFAARARALQARFHTDVAYSAWSGVRLQRELAQRGDGERSFAPVVFACNLGTPLLDDRTRRSLGELGYMISQTPQVWLDHQVYEQGGGVLLAWDALEDLFPDGLIDAMFGAYVRLLDHLAEDAAAWEAPLPALLPPGQHAVREMANATDVPVAPRTLHQPIFEQATAHPKRTALIDGANGQTVDYGTLAHRTLQVAALLHEQGVRPGDPVAVTLPRGIDQVVAVLGVLAAGACYVPVGIAQPVARQERIHRRAGVRHVLTDQGRMEAIRPTGADVIDVAQAALRRPLTQPVSVAPDAPAYVIFTSGSTGEPKGVEISHRAAANTIDDLNQRCGVGPDDRVLAVSALDFDLSVYDLFGLLGAGGAVVLLAEDDRRDASVWLRLVHEQCVTLWNSVPVLLDMLLVAAEGDGRPLPLRLAMASGDWIGLDLPARLARMAPAARFVAMGGATEAAIWSNLCEVTLPLPNHWRSIPYGRPLANQRYRVVDTQGRDCPDWVAGELWIGGAGVARGYRGDPQRTAEAFVEHDGLRWYRTGDLGRYWPDGTLEFLGRRDHQIKLRGHRIELGEIEAALLAQPGVRQAVALVAGQPPALAAALVAEGPPDIGALATALRMLLPDYMVPASWLALDALPLSANGKIDRRELENRVIDHLATSSSTKTPPEGAVEEKIAAVWRELLRHDAPIYRNDHFFRLGGDSLVATQVVARLQRDGLRAAQPLRHLFARPILADFAAIWQSGGLSTPTIPSLHPNSSEFHEPFALTEVQQAYWMGQADGLPLHCGTLYLIELDGSAVDLARFDTAWRALWQRHDMLRACVDDDGHQYIPREIPDIVLRIEPAEPDANAARARIVECWRQRDRTRASPPLHVVHAVPYADGRCRLGLIFDYLTLDGYSVKLLLSELVALYRNPTRLPAPPQVNFRDYVTQTAPDATARDEAEEYWRERLDTLPPAPALPLACEPATLGLANFARWHARLPAPQWQRLRDAAQRYGLTPSVLLLTVYAHMLSYWSGGSAHTLNLTLFDRRDVHPDVHSMLGDFTTLAPVPFEPQTQTDLIGCAHDMQRRIAEVLEHRAVSSIWVQRERAHAVGLQAAALPVVFTSTLGMADGFFDDLPEGFPDLADGGLSETPQVWLDHQVYEHRGELVLCWDAVPSLFPDGLIDAMFGAYVRLLDHLAEDAAAWEAPLPALLPPGQHAVREMANATDVPVAPRTLHQPIFEQATAHPKRTALIDGANGQTVDYGTLAHRTLQVAALLHEQGVRPGDPVAVTLPRGIDQVVAVLGVLAAGACYVPVGIAQPVARQERIHRRAGVRHVLTDQGRMEAIRPTGADVIDVAQAALRRPLTQPVSVAPDAPAYVIFTSGSTGEPKGVEISHRAAANTIDDLNQRCGVGPDDRVLAVSALDFDLSVYDLFGLLGAGGAVVLLAEDDRRDASVWLRLVHEQCVTLWNSVPVLLDMLLVAAEGDGRPLPLRLAMASGDWIGLDLPARLARMAPAARFVAMGGATEAAIWSNLCEVTLPLPNHWRSIPYGRPLANQRYRVVDTQGRDCPDWVAGELWIGGAGVARGYRGDPQRTAEAFVEHDGLRWYRTGDLGRYWPDGTLEFLGRRDHQIKLRGHRIELGEIEAALLAQPGVRQAVALVAGQPPALAAALVAEGPPDIGALATALRMLLPDYMVPASWLALDALPLSANGKIDRRELENRLAATMSPAHYEPPRDPLERELAALWEEVLGCKKVSRHDDFFQLGGDSLRATRLIEALRQRGPAGGGLSLRKVFSAPTVAAQAALLRAQNEQSESAVVNTAFEEGTL
ncbi:amino acid adenylation domain-containing protein [Chitinivorax sp. PXF-14]|uniref:amino acid adenylation domain-containing protein n=1 Tax=Chitinivorax sp. PXF-14 TaxID=3230488 RepID=UPI00346704BE